MFSVAEAHCWPIIQAIVLSESCCATTLDLYEKATKQGKGQILSLLSAGMKAKGTRFLKKDSMDIWRDLDADAAKIKIGHALRDAARPNRKRSANDAAKQAGTLGQTTKGNDHRDSTRNHNLNHVVAQVLDDIETVSILRLLLVAGAVSMPAPYAALPKIPTMTALRPTLEGTEHALMTSTNIFIANTGGEECDSSTSDDYTILKNHVPQRNDFQHLHTSPTFEHVVSTTCLLRLSGEPGVEDQNAASIGGS